MKKVLPSKDEIIVLLKAMGMTEDLMLTTLQGLALIRASHDAVSPCRDCDLAESTDLMVTVIANICKETYPGAKDRFTETLVGLLKQMHKAAAEAGHPIPDEALTEAVDKLRATSKKMDAPAGAEAPSGTFTAPPSKMVH